MNVSMRLSPEAWDHIIELSIKYGYIHQESKNFVGVGLFINALADAELVDARPEEARAGDGIRMMNGLVPDWTNYLFRVQRAISVSDKAIENLAIKAKKLCILPPIRATNLSLATILMEALGEGNLRIENIEVRETPKTWIARDRRAKRRLTMPY